LTTAGSSLPKQPAKVGAIIVSSTNIANERGRMVRRMPTKLQSFGDSVRISAADAVVNCAPFVTVED
jgi:hypothetical protein